MAHDPCCQIDNGNLPPELRQGLAQGIGARIMPSKHGWKVDYFSVPDWENEPGTDFPSFAAAMDAVAEILPEVNTAERRAGAQNDPLTDPTN